MARQALSKSPWRIAGVGAEATGQGLGEGLETAALKASCQGTSLTPHHDAC